MTAGAAVMNTTAPQRHRWSIRAKLITLVVLGSAVGLSAVAIMLPVFLRSELLADRDTTLVGVLADLPKGEISLDALIQQDSPLQGGLGWSVVSPQGVARVYDTPARYSGANPAVGATPPIGSPGTVGDVRNPDREYRIIGLPFYDPYDGSFEGFLVAWSPLSDIDETIGRLVLAEVFIVSGLLLLIGSVSGLMVRRSLKPLETMAEAADEIRGGDLERRVAVDEAETEMGRLGSAFNGMLDSISDLVDDRSRGEERLRRFIADASHELRTPVAAVQGYSDLYRAGALPDDAAVGRAMERMGFEARRMGSLVEDLLTLVQADAPDRIARERVELNDLLIGVVEDAAAIDATRTWQLAPIAQPVSVAGDRMRLHQLFANLLGNVRTHTPEGTTATVSVLPGPDRVAVTVFDDGPGVSEADLSRLFDRFFRADPSRSRANGGTGLGLSIVQALAKAHGGEVLASRGPAGGLAVTVLLPLAVGTAAVPTDPSRPIG